MLSRMLAAGKLVKGTYRWQICTLTTRKGWALNDSARFPCYGRLWLTDVPSVRTTFLRDSRK